MANETIENQGNEELQSEAVQPETVDWEAKYKELQKESRKWENRAKANKTAAEELSKAKEANKTAEERRMVEGSIMSEIIGSAESSTVRGVPLIEES